MAYEANPEAYIKEIKAAYTDALSLYDTNMNSMMELDEHVRFFKVHGLKSDIYDIESFRIAYNNTDSVPLADVIDTWLQFGSDTTTNPSNDTIDQAIKMASHEEL